MAATDTSHHEGRSALASLGARKAWNEPNEPIDMAPQARKATAQQLLMSDPRRWHTTSEGGPWACTARPYSGPARRSERMVPQLGATTLPLEDQNHRQDQQNPAQPTPD